MRALVLSFALLAGAAPGFAQTPPIPRTPDGRPDFQGTWDSRWRTPLERPKEADGPLVAANKADALLALIAARRAANTGLHPEGDFDDGPLMPAPGGGFRTSLIVEPANGMRPLTKAAQDLLQGFSDQEKTADGPEAFSPATRCVRGPGIAPLALSPDQMYRQIVETPGYVVIATENMGDVRIIELGGRTRPDALLTWGGDSAGRWDGDTLVVETTRFWPDPLAAGAPPGQARRRLVERLKFNSPDELDYTYVLDDPSILTAPMRVNFILRRTQQRMFESACHEGNYGLPNMMAGARIEEQRSATAAAPKPLSHHGKQNRRPRKEAGGGDANVPR